MLKKIETITKNNHFILKTPYFITICNFFCFSASRQLYHSFTIHRVYQVKWSLMNRCISASVYNIHILKIVLRRYLIAVFVWKSVGLPNGQFCCDKIWKWLCNFSLPDFFLESYRKMIIIFQEQHQYLSIWLNKSTRSTKNLEVQKISEK